MTCANLNDPNRAGGLTAHTQNFRDIKGLFTEHEVCTVKYQTKVFSMEHAKKEV